MAFSEWIIENTMPDGTFRPGVILICVDECEVSLTGHLNSKNHGTYIPREDHRDREFHHTQAISQKGVSI